MNAINWRGNVKYKMNIKSKLDRKGMDDLRQFMDMPDAHGLDISTTVAYRLSTAQTEIDKLRREVEAKDKLLSDWKGQLEDHYAEQQDDMHDDARGYGLTFRDGRFVLEGE